MQQQSSDNSSQAPKSTVKVNNKTSKNTIKSFQIIWLQKTWKSAHYGLLWHFYVAFDHILHLKKKPVSLFCTKITQTKTEKRIIAKQKYNNSIIIIIIMAKEHNKMAQT